MPRKTGRDAGTGQFIPLAQAAAMGERATIESNFTGRITPRMHAAGIAAVSMWANRKQPAPDDNSEHQLVDDVFRAMWDARPR